MPYVKGLELTSVGPENDVVRRRVIATLEEVEEEVSSFNVDVTRVNTRTHVSATLELETVCGDTEIPTDFTVGSQKFVFFILALWFGKYGCPKVVKLSTERALRCSTGVNNPSSYDTAYAGWA